MLGKGCAATEVKGDIEREFGILRESTATNDTRYRRSAEQSNGRRQAGTMAAMEGEALALAMRDLA